MLICADTQRADACRLANMRSLNHSWVQLETLLCASVFSRSKNFIYIRSNIIAMTLVAVPDGYTQVSFKSKKSVTVMEQDITAPRTHGNMRIIFKCQSPTRWMS